MVIGASTLGRSGTYIDPAAANPIELYLKIRVYKIYIITPRR